jgi:transposase
MEQNRKAKRGYSRDGWPDCLQVVIALVITQPPRRITANPIAHPAAS